MIRNIEIKIKLKLNDCVKLRTIGEILMLSLMKLRKVCLIPGMTEY